MEGFRVRNGLPYYKAYPRDFIEGTIGMPFEIKCAYRVILDLIYMQGGNLPDDDRYISGLLGCSIRKWKSIRSDLISRGKLDVSDGFLTNKRARKELETLAKLQHNQSEKASRPRKNNSLQQPRHSQPEPEPEPEPLRVGANAPTTGARSKDFERFWAAFPSKVEKKGAEKKFALAVKSGVDPDRIISAAERYANSEKVHRGFVKNPTTWLNNGCWDDLETEHTAQPPPSNQVSDEIWKAVAEGKPQ
jgi:uncharacterized protein YdaU (DUF1376 family)